MSLRMVLIIRIKYLGRKNGCMDITMLGTGSALVTECYNTCFVLSDGDEHFLVDGGGGNGILSQLKKAGFNWQDMRTIFVTHKHVDHILGAVWMIRMICQHMKKVRMKAKPLYTDMTRSSLYLGDGNATS